MNSTTLWLECRDGARIFVRRWIPQNSPGAVLQIAHGMAEHSKRYERLAEKLCGLGIEVWAADQRGHGLSADPGINGPEKGGQLGHCADKNGFFKVVGDLDSIFDAIRKEYPSLPLFLLGHSWGSFISLAYIEAQGKRLAGCILSGTRGPGGADLVLGAPFTALVAAVKGCRKKSKLVFSMTNGPYNKPFRPNRTAFDWLSRDEQVVDAYIADPLCGFMCSTGFYRDMTEALRTIYKPEELGKIPPGLPLYVFSGSADPVGAMGNGPTALIGLFKDLGFRDIEFVLYPDARHETLNETNRDEVTGSLLEWLKKHPGPRG